MLHFADMRLEDQSWAKPLIAAGNLPGCEYTFGGNFIWSEAYGVQIAQVEGMYVAKAGGEEDFSFLFPVGNGDLKACVDKLAEYCRERDKPLQFHSVLESSRHKLESLFPGEFSFTSDRDTFDYIYNAQDLITLSGKKYHGKRNHIRRFQENDWRFEPITRENLEECRQMHKEWCVINDCEHNCSKKAESCAVLKALDYYFDLGFTGGLLRVDGRVIAFTVGEPLNSNTYVVHIEKAFADIQGAYPAINQEYARYAASDYQYINREDDTGSEGLRKAKLSYRPAILLEKFTARREPV